MCTALGLTCKWDGTRPLVKSVATSSPWIFILNPLICDRLLFSTLLPIFGPIHQSGSQQKTGYVLQLSIIEFTEGLFRKYRKEKCSMQVIADKYCGCLERAVTSTEGPSQPLGNLTLLYPSALLQASLPGTELQMGYPSWISMSLSYHLHFGVTAFLLSTVSQFFPPSPNSLFLF